jgi:hypothetical protein
MFSIADIQPEDDFEDTEVEREEPEDVPTASMPIRVSVSITKNNGPGAINVDMICQEGAFSVENVSFYDDAKVGTELTAEADWNRRGLYIGPQVSSLCVVARRDMLIMILISSRPSTLQCKTHSMHSLLSVVSTTPSPSSSRSTPRTRSNKCVS